jgi:hypothetical protein
VILDAYTHTRDCPDRKAAAADRRAHDTLAKAREQRLQLMALAEWFDAGPDHAPSYDPLEQRSLPPSSLHVVNNNPAEQPSPAVLELWASGSPAA